MTCSSSPCQKNIHPEPATGTQQASVACSSGSVNPAESFAAAPLTPRATNVASTLPKSPDKKKARTDDADDELYDNPLGLDMDLE